MFNILILEKIRSHQIFLSLSLLSPVKQNIHICPCVCLDLQLEEIRNIGSLPCLEKLNLSSNPMCIIPDYRTKILAQFGDRASEVHPPNHHTVNNTAGSLQH